MNNEFRNRRDKSYIRMRMVYDFTMAGLILAMGFILFFGDKFGLDLIAGLDPFMRYGFGGLCLLYGSFRVYRGIKHDY
jgi:hypothetical protein